MGGLRTTNVHQRRCGMSQKKLLKARLKRGELIRPTLERDKALLDAALRVWELKHGYE